LWARRILEGAPEPWRQAARTLRSIVDEAERDVLDRQLRPDEPAIGHGSGYVVDTLSSARMVQHETFAATVRAAVALGNDTDTTACVAGGIAGLRLGLDAIPLRWRESLRGRELFEPLLSALLGA
jgi:ADP-ribosylglycohydrolase